MTCMKNQTNRNSVEQKGHERSACKGTRSAFQAHAMGRGMAKGGGLEPKVEKDERDERQSGGHIPPPKRGVAISA